MADTADDRAIKESVKKAYARRAQERTCGCPPARSSCCSPKAQSVGECETKAAAIYSPAELAVLPESVVELSFGCGNPTAIAALRPGETVLDLGCGGGIDVFLAAAKVGPKGRAIGLDMTPEMLALARDNARKMRAANVEFRQGEMEAMPVEDGSIDVVISNCVINLSPDKDAVFREVYRVLKPGGRMAVSDIVLCSEPPAGVRDDPELWGSCVAGALLQDDYLDKIRRAGFRDARVESRVWENAAAFSGREWPEEVRRYLRDQVLSARVTASKP